MLGINEHVTIPNQDCKDSLNTEVTIKFVCLFIKNKKKNRIYRSSISINNGYDMDLLGL